MRKTCRTSNYQFIHFCISIQVTRRRPAITAPPPTRSIENVFFSPPNCRCRIHFFSCCVAHPPLPDTNQLTFHTSQMQLASQHTHTHTTFRTQALLRRRRPGRHPRQEKRFLSPPQSTFKIAFVRLSVCVCVREFGLITAKTRAHADNAVHSTRAANFLRSRTLAQKCVHAILPFHK